MTTSGPKGSVRAEFAVTRWTQVLRARGASPEARVALGELCEAYYGPVEAFLRLRCGDRELAREHAQEFFARLLSGDGGALSGADPVRGRFRSYLLGAVKHYLHAERTRREAAKRGGGSIPESLDSMAEANGGEPVILDVRAESADSAFDRRWAEWLLDRALGRLETAFRAEGKGPLFEVLKPTLQGAQTPPPQREMAAALGLSRSAAKVAIHRLRRKFREAVAAAISKPATP